jgi:hypothetical protein
MNTLKPIHLSQKLTQQNYPNRVNSLAQLLQQQANKSIHPSGRKPLPNANNVYQTRYPVANVEQSTLPIQ